MQSYILHLECSKTGVIYPVDQIHNLSDDGMPLLVRYDLKKIKDEFIIKLKGKLNLLEINQIKSDLFGKNGLVSSQFKKIGSIPVSEKKNLHQN